MTRDSPKQPDLHAVGGTQHAKKNSSFLKFLGISKPKNKTSKQLSSEDPPNEKTTHSLVVASLDFSSNSTTSLSTMVRPRKDFFRENVSRPGIKTTLPRLQERIERTEQLIYCNALLLQHSSSQSTTSSGEKSTLTPIDDCQELASDKAELEWLAVMDKDPMEQEQLHWLVTRMVEEFVLDPIKDSVKIAEIVALGPVLDREHYRKLLSSIIGG
ncbi:hypothetical protein BGW39_003898, partial [Mortierella sp. 14UC]